MFDPLAVLLLIAANQSLMRRFPPEPPKPQEIVDLEKPDDEGVDLKWNAMMDKSDAATKMEAATEQLKVWKQKLDAFNHKVPKPEDKPVEFIQEDLQKKTEDKEIDAFKDFEDAEAFGYTPEPKDGFDPDEVIFDMETVPNVDKEKQLEEFKKREEEEKEALKEYARKAREEEVTATLEEALKMPASESLDTPIDEGRIKPDLTTVIEPEQKIKPRSTVEADMSKLAIEPDIGEFTGGYKPSFVKKSQEKIKKEAYVQNEEQTDKTVWTKIKAKSTSEEHYHEMQEKRINDLMTKVDSGEVKLEDLTPEDRQVIIDIRMQNESGDNQK